MALKQRPPGRLRRVLGPTFVGLCVVMLGYGTWAAQSGVAAASGTIAADSPQVLDATSGAHASGGANSRGVRVTIDADQTECNADKQSCAYSGHVRFSTKHFVILGDKATANRSDSGLVLTMSGTPATFTHTPSSGSGLVRGEAERIDLDGGAGEVRLAGNASLIQGYTSPKRAEQLVYKFR